MDECTPAPRTEGTFAAEVSIPLVDEVLTTRVDGGVFCLLGMTAFETICGGVFDREGEGTAELVDCLGFPAMGIVGFEVGLPIDTLVTAFVAVTAVRSLLPAGAVTKGAGLAALVALRVMAVGVVLRGTIRVGIGGGVFDLKGVAPMLFLAPVVAIVFFSPMPVPVPGVMPPMLSPLLPTTFVALLLRSKGLETTVGLVTFFGCTVLLRVGSTEPQDSMEISSSSTTSTGAMIFSSHPTTSSMICEMMVSTDCIVL